MKYNHQNYEEWVMLVGLSEKERAKKKLAQGEPIEQVLEEMSERIKKKLMHPLIKLIK